MIFQPFNFKSSTELRQAADAYGILLPWQDSLESLAQPVTLGQASIPNRILAQPIEGFDAEANGAPSERSVNRYCELACGRFGCLWMESISVNLEGRSNPSQLWLHDDTVDDFAAMLREVRASVDEPVYLVAQLTHSGRYSTVNGKPAPVCAFENPLIPKENGRIITDEEIDLLIEDYLYSVHLAAQAGFDAVDIRACHGYLINELFAAYHRPGRYGGNFENRVRMLMSIVQKAIDADEIEVGVRLNMHDGLPWPYGWGMNAVTGEMDLAEPLRLVEMLYEVGVRLFNISNGIGATTPFMIRPYDTGGPLPTESQLAGINRMLQCARSVKKIAPESIVVASGFTWLREYSPNVAAGGIEANWFDVAGWGRQSIAWPSFASAVLNNTEVQRDGCCTTCCGCTNLIKKSGKQLRCVLRKRLEKSQ